MEKRNHSHSETGRWKKDEEMGGRCVPRFPCTMRRRRRLLAGSSSACARPLRRATPGSTAGGSSRGQGDRQIRENYSSVVDLRWLRLALLFCHSRTLLPPSSSCHMQTSFEALDLPCQGGHAWQWATHWCVLIKRSPQFLLAATLRVNEADILVCRLLG